MSENESGKSTGGIFGSLRRIFGGRTSPEPERVTDAAPFDPNADLKLNEPPSAAPEPDLADSDSDEDPLVLEPTMRPVDPRPLETQASGGLEVEHTSDDGSDSQDDDVMELVASVSNAAAEADTVDQDQDDDVADLETLLAGSGRNDDGDDDAVTARELDASTVDADPLEAALATDDLSTDDLVGDDMAQPSPDEDAAPDETTDDTMTSETVPSADEPVIAIELSDDEVKAVEFDDAEEEAPEPDIEDADADELDARDLAAAHDAQSELDASGQGDDEADAVDEIAVEDAVERVGMDETTTADATDEIEVTDTVAEADMKHDNGPTDDNYPDAENDDTGDASGEPQEDDDGLMRGPVTSAAAGIVITASRSGTNDDSDAAKPEAEATDPASEEKSQDPAAGTEPDPAALEETVRRILREELAGEIGQNLSKNIKRMIRDEILKRF